MKGLPFVLLFTAMTFIAWGSYGPTLHHGATALHHDSLRAFVGVGLAYFLIAVLIPFAVLKRSGEVGRWTLTGTIYSLVAGAVGAVGALGILLALGYGGLPIYVMPLVFGFAPVVNTLVTAFLSRTFNQIRPIFVVGVLTAALGAVGVLVYKPTPAKAEPKTTVAAAAAPAAVATVTPVKIAVPAQTATSDGAEDATNETIAEDADPAELEADSVTETAAEGVEATKAEEPEEPEEAEESSAPPVIAAESAPATSAAVVEAPEKKPVQWWGVLGSIIVAAGCWGSYGPVLHIGQSKMAGSRLRPFACVGLAYFLIAVAAPLVLIYTRSTDLGAWTAVGMGWSFVAGVAGAVGALGVILAFNAGGKPYYVMPLVFSFAPVINTFISVGEAGTWGRIPLMFWVSLAVVIAGAVTVLINAPRPKPHK